MSYLIDMGSNSLKSFFLIKIPDKKSETTNKSNKSSQKNKCLQIMQVLSYAPWL